MWLEFGWKNRSIPQEQLYDLIFNPEERRNLAQDPALAGVLRDMRRRLDAWMRATQDPLLHGSVKAPPGAVVNSPDGLSPQEPTHPANS